MKLALNPRTGSLAHRVRDDFRLLSQDTRSLLNQALNTELPSARRRLMDAAGGRFDQGRQWLSENSQALRQNPRLPILIGAAGLAALAGASWFLFRPASRRFFGG
jgi:hypothetical protein